MDPQQWLAMNAIYMNGGNSPTLYPTGQAPDPDAPELDPYAQYIYGTMAAPNTNKSGELLPYNLDYQKSLTNYQQDINQIIADPLNAYMASLYGGEGFAPGVFNQVPKESVMKFTQMPMLQAMAQAGGYQGTLAKLMLPKDVGGRGLNPATAAALLQKVIEHPEAAAEAQLTADEVAKIKGELPPVINTQNYGGPQVVPDMYDWKSVANDANTMWQPMAQERATIFNPDGTLKAGVIQKDDGQFYSQEMVDSPQLEFIKKLGLPDPNARYDLKYALENDPTIAGLFQHSADTQDQADMMRKTFSEYTKKIAKQREAAARAKAEDAARMAAYKSGPLKQWADQATPYGNAVKQSLADYLSQVGRGGMEEVRLPGALVAPGDPGYQPFGEQQAGGLSLAKPVYSTPGHATLNLPKGGPGAAPAAPQLSPFNGRTADEVAQLFNAAANLLPSSMQLPRQAVEAQRAPLLAQMKAASKAEKETGTAYMRSLIANYARNAAGRTPAKDVAQQRLLPLYASGAMGQQGLPTAYPSRAAVQFMLGG